MGIIYTTRGYKPQSPFLKPNKFVYYDFVNLLKIRIMYAKRNKLEALMEGYLNVLRTQHVEVKEWFVKDKELVIQLAKGSARIRQRSLEKLYTVLYTLDEKGDKNSWCDTLSMGLASTEKQRYIDSHVIYLRDLAVDYTVVLKTHEGETIGVINRIDRSETSASSIKIRRELFA